MPASVPSNADFLASIPGRGFMGATAGEVTEALTEAAAMTGTRCYTAEQSELAVFLRAAILLFDQPNAYKMRDSDPKAVSRWERRLFQLQRSATMGVRTVGQRGDETL